MEDNQSILNLIHNEFHAKPVKINEYSPLTLAYIGDAVYDLIIRTLIVEEKNLPVKKLHSLAITYVNAGTQAAMILSIEDELTEEEHQIYKRGRNAKASSVAKNANIKDYRNATGFEALFGYLYLTGQLDRALALASLSLNRIGKSLIKNEQENE